jgi:DNA repair exonuclease SbcCD nuclease subunit
MTNQLQILHLSDLHIGKDNNFDRSTVLCPLIERVKKDLKEGLKPELVIVTGDIAFKGIKKEYDEAKKFFTDLLKELKLPDQRLFIVPGNHDVDRTKYRPKDVPVYENMKELNDELGNKEYRKDLLKGMPEYFDFIKTNFPHIESLEDNLIPFVTSYKAECKKKVALVGMNSAWMCREKNTEIGKIAIGQYQIKTAMDLLNKKKEKLDLIICAFHHPINWLWLDDRNISKQYLKDKVVLCGHLHDTSGGWYDEIDSSYHLFQAGTTYLNKEKWPERYHYLTYDWDEKK